MRVLTNYIENNDASGYFYGMILKFLAQTKLIVIQN